MSQLEQIFWSVAGIWVMLSGIAWMVGGPKKAGALQKWGFRAILALVGGTLVWAGTQLRGKKK